MKPHFTGATYALTQENINGLIEQLEVAEVNSEFFRRLSFKYWNEITELRHQAEKLAEVLKRYHAPSKEEVPQWEYTIELANQVLAEYEAKES